MQAGGDLDQVLGRDAEHGPPRRILRQGGPQLPRGGASGRACRAAASAREGGEAPFDRNDPLTWFDDGTGGSLEPAVTQTLSTTQMAALITAEPPKTRAGGSAPTVDEKTGALSGVVAGLMDAEDAIDRGLDQFEAGNIAAAIELFQAALELPGSGVKRDRKLANELSFGERVAVSYNLCCCYCRLSQRESDPALLERALEYLTDCLQAGFEDYDALKKDADLAPLRAMPGYKRLMESYQPKGMLNKLRARIDDAIGDVEIKE